MKHSIKLNTETTFMKYSIILVFLLLLFVFPLASAEVIGTDDASIRIIIAPDPDFTTNHLLNVTVGFINKDNPEYPQNYTIPVDTSKFETKDGTNTTRNCRSFVISLIQDISGLEDTTYFKLWNKTEEELKKCEIDLGKCEISWTLCNVELGEYEGENTTLCRKDLDECSLSLKEKDLDLGAKDEKILNLEDEKEDTKNSKYIWGVIGLALGAVGLYLYQKKGGSPKDKSMGEFQRSQAR